jgi:phage terminase large subunit-like protein
MEQLVERVIGRPLLAAVRAAPVQDQGQLRDALGKHRDGTARGRASQDAIGANRDRAGGAILLWAEQGHIVATPGSVVDYGAVEDHVAELAERFRVEAIAIDRWNSTATTTRLLDQGLPVVRFGQGFASMSPAVKETERLILSRRLAHDGNPVMRFCLSNVAIAADAAGNIKIDRARAREKVDGAVALAMAIGTAETEGRSTSVYAERPSFLFV